ncbi:MAG: immunoglobulin domain-containing protein [Verrucomicrobiales bacterium]|nr:immunoglobulin domain-containing protein [Verrucomicrobiales bacterium]
MTLGAGKVRYFRSRLLLYLDEHPVLVRGTNLNMKANLPLLLVLCVASNPAVAQPIITSQPADQTANQGYSATFQLRATGTVPLSYAWFFNQSVIAGATTNRFTITNAQPADAGDYFAIVTDATDSITSQVAKLTVVAPAKLDPKIRPNIRMSDDPEELPVNNRAQAELHIERSPVNPSILLATFQEARQPAGGGLGIGYAYSEDSGLNWRRGLLPGLGPLFGGTDNVADSVAAFDLRGKAYINCLNNTVSGVAVSAASLGALLFGNPRNVPGTISPDKNWMAVNTFANSPAANRLLVTWTEFPNNGSSSYSVRSVFSDDAGANWSKPVIITTAPRTGTQPIFFPDGSAAVVFSDGASQIEIVSSADGGQTYGTSRLVAKFVQHKDSRARDPGAFPSLATDRLAGVIYLT